MELINNGHITLDTLNYVNKVIHNVYNIELQDIKTLDVERSEQVKIARNWDNTHLGLNSKINNIPTWLTKLSYSINENTNQSSHTAVFGVDLSKVGEYLIQETGEWVAQTNDELVIPVPTDFNGNNAFVELYVTEYVTSQLTRLTAPTSGSPMFNMTTLKDDANKWAFGCTTRKDPVLFYSQFVAGKLGINYALHKDVIKFTMNIPKFLKPFDIIHPEMHIVITFFRAGVSS